MINWDTMPPIEYPDGIYILNDDHQPVAVGHDMRVYLKWRDANPDLYRVAFDRIGNAEVSTVFLGFDKRINRKGRPLLFETMIFGGGYQKQQRYSTYDEAMAGHAEIAVTLKGAVQ